MQVAKTSKPLFGLLLQSSLARFADQTAAIVYGWAILQQTGSGFWAGVVIAANVGVLITGTLFAGRLIARFGARPVALAGAWLSVLSTTVIAVLLWQGSAHPLWIAAVCAVGACLEGPSNIASETNYPEVARIARWDLLRLNALDHSLENLAGLVAPAAGAAMVVAVGSAYGAVIIAVLCLISAVVLTAALPAFSRLQSAQAVSLGPVLAHLRQDRVLFPLTVLFSLVMALLGSLQFIILPLAVKQAGLTAGSGDSELNDAQVMMGMLLVEVDEDVMKATVLAAIVYRSVVGIACVVVGVSRIKVVRSR